MIASATRTCEGMARCMAALKFDWNPGTGLPWLVSADTYVSQQPMFPPPLSARISPSGAAQTRPIPESSRYTGMAVRPPSPKLRINAPLEFSSPTHSLTQQPPPAVAPRTMLPDEVCVIADTLPGQGSTVEPPRPKVGSRRPPASTRAISHPLAVLPARIVLPPGAGMTAEIVNA